MKKSAKIIHEKLQGSLLKVLPKMYHGKFSINYVNDYMNGILQIVKKIDCRRDRNNNWRKHEIGS